MVYELSMNLPCKFSNYIFVLCTFSERKISELVEEGIEVIVDNLHIDVKTQDVQQKGRNVYTKVIYMVFWLLVWYTVVVVNDYAWWINL